MPRSPARTLSAHTRAGSILRRRAATAAALVAAVGITFIPAVLAAD